MGAPIPQHVCHFPARMLEFLEIAAYMAVRMRARPYAYFSYRCVRCMVIAPKHAQV
jgi:hypothetical protein